MEYRDMDLMIAMWDVIAAITRVLCKHVVLQQPTRLRLQFRCMVHDRSGKHGDAISELD
jgi:hypothetical protein